MKGRNQERVELWQRIAVWFVGAVTLTAVSAVTGQINSVAADEVCSGVTDDFLNRICERYCETFDCDSNDGATISMFRCKMLEATWETRLGAGTPFPCVPAAPVPRTGLTTSYEPGDDREMNMGVPWPVPRITNNLDGTVTDNLTGLTWTRSYDGCGLEKMTYFEALEFASNLADGECGLSDGSAPGDWRIPNIRELLSILTFGNTEPSLPDYLEAFANPSNNSMGERIWSSSTDVDETWKAFIVGFKEPFFQPWDKFGQNAKVWCVRGGQ